MSNLVKFVFLLFITMPVFAHNVHHDGGNSVIIGGTNFSPYFLTLPPAPIVGSQLYHEKETVVIPSASAQEVYNERDIAYTTYTHDKYTLYDREGQ